MHTEQTISYTSYNLRSILRFIVTFQQILLPQKCHRQKNKINIIIKSIYLSLYLIYTYLK